MGKNGLLLLNSAAPWNSYPAKARGSVCESFPNFLVTIRPRQGGERLRPDRNRPRRSLKNLFREASLPPWEREMLPLIFSGDILYACQESGVDCDFQAVAEEPGLMVEWRQTASAMI